MVKVYAFLAEGFEEVECLAAADVMVRAGLEVTLVSVSDSQMVTGSHGFRITAGKMLKDIDMNHADVLFLPGGMPGTGNLAACKDLCDGLVRAAQDGKRLAAICAAPSVLGQLGILKGRTVTCYPGYEESLLGAHHTAAGVVTDGNITTARGLGYALDLGLELVRILIDEETALRIKSAIQYDSCRK